MTSRRVALALILTERVEETCETVPLIWTPFQCPGTRRFLDWAMHSQFCTMSEPFHLVDTASVGVRPLPYSVSGMLISSYASSRIAQLTPPLVQLVGEDEFIRSTQLSCRHHPVSPSFPGRF